METIDKCPFCGKDAGFNVKATGTKNFYRSWQFGITCKGCGVSTPKTDYQLSVYLNDQGEIIVEKDEREDAVASWNRRI